NRPHLAFGGSLASPNGLARGSGSASSHAFQTMPPGPQPPARRTQPAKNRRSNGNLRPYRRKLCEADLPNVFRHLANRTDPAFPRKRTGRLKGGATRFQVTPPADRAQFFRQIKGSSGVDGKIPVSCRWPE